jgi:hypothetical protein
MKPSNKLINFIIAEFELEISNKLKPFTLLIEVKDGKKQRIRSIGNRQPTWGRT